MKEFSEESSLDNSVNDLKKLVQEVFEEYHSVQSKRTEPAYKAELEIERKKRELMEKRLNELINENRQAKAQAESIERESIIRSELAKLGVTKIDLAYKAVKDDILRDPDGRLHGRGVDGPIYVGDFLKKFVDENPELLPARNLGGSGTSSSGRKAQSSPGIDIDSIHPGMSSDELARVRKEIARVAGLIVE